VLCLSSIEAHAFRVEPAPASLASLTAMVAFQLTPFAASTHAVLGTELHADLPPQLIFDSLRFSQVLCNFATNALKHVRDDGSGRVLIRARLVPLEGWSSDSEMRDSEARGPGGDTIELPALGAHVPLSSLCPVLQQATVAAWRARSTGSGSGRACPVRVPAVRVRLEVSDNGCGIPPGEQGKIFQPYFQIAGSAGSKKVAGTGLGLAIAKEIVTLHGGTVGLTSVEAASPSSGAVDTDTRADGARHELASAADERGGTSSGTTFWLDVVLPLAPPAVPTDTGTSAGSGAMAATPNAVEGSDTGSRQEEAPVATRGGAAGATVTPAAPQPRSVTVCAETRVQAPCGSEDAAGTLHPLLPAPPRIAVDAARDSSGGMLDWHASPAVSRWQPPHQEGQAARIGSALVCVGEGGGPCCTGGSAGSPVRAVPPAEPLAAVEPAAPWSPPPSGPPSTKTPPPQVRRGSSGAVSGGSSVTVMGGTNTIGSWYSSPLSSCHGGGPAGFGLTPSTDTPAAVAAGGSSATRYTPMVMSNAQLQFLLVDDDATNRRMMRRTLQSRFPRASFAEAANGLAALHAVGLSAAGELERDALPGIRKPATGVVGEQMPLRPDVLIVDGSMPVMDGYAFVRRLREVLRDIVPGAEAASMTGEVGSGHEVGGPSAHAANGSRKLWRPLIIGCTGNALLQDQEAFLAAGAVCVLTKPVTTGRLLAALAPAIAGAGREDVEAKAPRASGTDRLAGRRLEDGAAGATW
jgi:CheY-like chemotaxis protein